MYNNDLASLHSARYIFVNDHEVPLGGPGGQIGGAEDRVGDPDGRGGIQSQGHDGHIGTPRAFVQPQRQPGIDAIAAALP